MLLQECLNSLEASSADFFQECITAADEMKKLRKSFLRLCLLHHPDKGGDAANFRKVRTAFQTLKEIAKTFGSSERFSNNKTRNVDQTFEKAVHYDDNGSTPSWEFYEAAAADEFPTYKVEPAKSNRSKCSAKGKAKKCEEVSIQRGEIRCGAFNRDYGSYMWWKHLKCWRVPSKLWLGLPDPSPDQGPAAPGRSQTVSNDPMKFKVAIEKLEGVLISGFSDLSNEAKQLFIAHCMDKSNWTRYTKPRASIILHPQQPHSTSSSTSGGSYRNSGATSSTVAPRKQVFVTPIPGENGFHVNALAGKTIVITGTFPEMGGGAGLKVGIQKCRKLLESFGAKVRSAVSGKTDYLLLGKEPGAGKINKAKLQQMGKNKSLQIVNLPMILQACKGTNIAAIAEPSPGALSWRSVESGIKLLDYQKSKPEVTSEANSTNAVSVSVVCQRKKKRKANSTKPSSRSLILPRKKNRKIASADLSTNDYKLNLKIRALEAKAKLEQSITTSHNQPLSVQLESFLSKHPNGVTNDMLKSKFGGDLRPLLPIMEELYTNDKLDLDKDRGRYSLKRKQKNIRSSSSSSNEM
eukprot:g4364.t1